MKIVDLKTKTVENVYGVYISNTCDDAEGYYTTLEEAKEKADKVAELVKREVVVFKMIWSEEDNEYVDANMYDTSKDITVYVVGEQQ